MDFGSKYKYFIIEEIVSCVYCNIKYLSTYHFYILLIDRYLFKKNKFSNCGYTINFNKLSEFAFNLLQKNEED